MTVNITYGRDGVAVEGVKMTKMAIPAIILLKIEALAGSESTTQSQVTSADEATPALCAANAASLGSALYHNSDNDNRAMIDLIMRKDRTPADDAEVEHLRNLTAWAAEADEALEEQYPDAEYDAAAEAAFAVMDHDALVDKAAACLS